MTKNISIKVSNPFVNQDSLKKKIQEEYNLDSTPIDFQKIYNSLENIIDNNLEDNTNFFPKKIYGPMQSDDFTRKNSLQKNLLDLADNRNYFKTINDSVMPYTLYDDHVRINNESAINTHAPSLIYNPPEEKITNNNLLIDNVDDDLSDVSSNDTITKEIIRRNKILKYTNYLIVLQTLMAFWITFSHLRKKEEPKGFFSKLKHRFF